MVSRSRRWLAIAVISVMSTATAGVSGQRATQPEPGTFLLTIFLRHDQSKTLDEIDAQLQRTGFREHFPPPGVEVVSWYVMMGIGQVVTVRVPPDKLRDVNLAIEHVGCLSHGVLSDLRLQADRGGVAAQGPMSRLTSRA
jgi:hypothetical protein